MGEKRSNKIMELIEGEKEIGQISYVVMHSEIYLSIDRVDNLKGDERGKSKASVGNLCLSL